MPVNFRELEAIAQDGNYELFAEKVDEYERILKGRKSFVARGGELYKPDRTENFKVEMIESLMEEILSSSDNHMMHSLAQIFIKMHKFNTDNEIEFFKIREAAANLRKKYEKDYQFILVNKITNEGCNGDLLDALIQVCNISSPGLIYNWETSKISDERKYSREAKNRLRSLKQITYVVDSPESRFSLTDRRNPQTMIWSCLKILSGLEKFGPNSVDARYIPLIVDTFLSLEKKPKIIYKKDLDGIYAGNSKKAELINVISGDISSLLTTLLHEMVHVVDSAIGDEILPLTQKYSSQIMRDKDALLLSGPRIFGEMYETYPQLKFPEEMLARAFELILVKGDKGLEFLRVNTPNLIIFIDDVFIPKCQKYRKTTRSFVSRLPSAEFEYSCDDSSDGLYDEGDFIFEEEKFRIPKKVHTPPDEEVLPQNPTTLPEVDAEDRIDEIATNHLDEDGDYDGDEENNEELPEVDKEDPLDRFKLRDYSHVGTGAAAGAGSAPSTTKR